MKFYGFMERAGAWRRLDCTVALMTWGTPRGRSCPAPAHDVEPSPTRVTNFARRRHAAGSGRLRATKRPTANFLRAYTLTLVEDPRHLAERVQARAVRRPASTLRALPQNKKKQKKKKKKKKKKKEKKKCCRP